MAEKKTTCEKNKCPFRKKYRTCGYCHKQNGMFEGYPEKETKKIPI